MGTLVIKNWKRHGSIIWYRRREVRTKRPPVREASTGQSPRAASKHVVETACEHWPVALPKICAKVVGHSSTVSCRGLVDLASGEKWVITMRRAIGAMVLRGVLVGNMSRGWHRSNAHRLDVGGRRIYRKEDVGKRFWGGSFSLHVWIPALMIRQGGSIRGRMLSRSPRTAMIGGSRGIWWLDGMHVVAAGHIF
jgi:hypothetical protein